MNLTEAIEYAKELMRNRNYCEISRSRIILRIQSEGRDLSKREVECIVIGNRVW